MSSNQGVSAQPLLSAAELFSQAAQLGRQREIVHCPDTDIIINHDAGLVPHAAALQKLFRGGIPDDWEELPFTYDNNIFTATVDGQPFVAKRRQWTNGDEDMEAIRRKRAEGVTGSALRPDYAINSVLSEIALAPKIKRLLQSREAEEIVSAFGFARIEYVEPVIAYIIRSTGEKGAVYGKVEESDWRFARFPVGDFEDTTKHITELLRRFGIRPMDFKSKHLVLDDQDGLHLIDTEMFYGTAV